MFKARIKMEVLRELTEVVSTLVSEVKLSVSKDGIEVKAVDPSHVAMLVLKLQKSAFEEFTGESTEIGLDVEKLKEVLRLSKPTDVLDLQYRWRKESTRDQGRQGHPTYVGRRSAGITDPKVPNVTPPASAVVKMEELRQGIRGSESISDHVTLTVDADGFSMHSEGETDRVDMHLPKDSLTKLEAKEPVKSMYLLDFFSAMMKSITSAEEVALHVGNEYPLKIEFTIADNRGSGFFLLAPRVEED